MNRCVTTVGWTAALADTYRLGGRRAVRNAGNGSQLALRISSFIRRRCAAGNLELVPAWVIEQTARVRRRHAYTEEGTRQTSSE